MIFSSIIVLFLFLPITLVLYDLVGKYFRNTLLLLASLVFYAWGEQSYVLVMLVSIGLNYVFGIFLNRVSELRLKKIVLVYGIIANLGMLFLFKYANFVIDNIKIFLTVVDVPAIDSPPAHLPIGISFLRFRHFLILLMCIKRRLLCNKMFCHLGCL